VAAFVVTNCGLGYALEPASKLRQVNGPQAKTVAKALGEELNPSAKPPEIEAPATGARLPTKAQIIKRRALVLAGLMAVGSSLHSWFARPKDYSPGANQTTVSGPAVAGSDPKVRKTAEVSAQDDIYELTSRASFDNSALQKIIAHAHQLDIEAFEALMGMEGASEEIGIAVRSALAGFDIQRLKQEANSGDPRAIYIAERLSLNGITSEAVKDLQIDIGRLVRLASGGDYDAPFTLGVLNFGGYQGASGAVKAVNIRALYAKARQGEITAIKALWELAKNNNAEARKALKYLTISQKLQQNPKAASINALECLVIAGNAKALQLIEQFAQQADMNAIDVALRFANHDSTARAMNLRLINTAPLKTEALKGNQKAISMLANLTALQNPHALKDLLETARAGVPMALEEIQLLVNEEVIYMRMAHLGQGVDGPALKSMLDKSIISQDPYMLYMAFASDENFRALADMIFPRLLKAAASQAFVDYVDSLDKNKVVYENFMFSVANFGFLNDILVNNDIIRKVTDYLYSSLPEDSLRARASLLTLFVQKSIDPSNNFDRSRKLYLAQHLIEICDNTDGNTESFRRYFLTAVIGLNRPYFSQAQKPAIDRMVKQSGIPQGALTGVSIPEHLIRPAGGKLVVHVFFADSDAAENSYPLTVASIKAHGYTEKSNDESRTVLENEFAQITCIKVRGRFNIDEEMADPKVNVVMSRCHAGEERGFFAGEEALPAQQSSNERGNYPFKLIVLNSCRSAVTSLSDILNRFTNTAGIGVVGTAHSSTGDEMLLLLVDGLHHASKQPKAAQWLELEQYVNVNATPAERNNIGQYLFPGDPGEKISHILNLYGQKLAPTATTAQTPGQKLPEKPSAFSKIMRWSVLALLLYGVFYKVTHPAIKPPKRRPPTLPTRPTGSPVSKADARANGNGAKIREMVKSGDIDGLSAVLNSGKKLKVKLLKNILFKMFFERGNIANAYETIEKLGLGSEFQEARDVVERGIIAIKSMVHSGEPFADIRGLISSVKAYAELIADEDSLGRAPNEAEKTLRIHSDDIVEMLQKLTEQPRSEIIAEILIRPDSAANQIDAAIDDVNRLKAELANLEISDTESVRTSKDRLNYGIDVLISILKNRADFARGGKGAPETIDIKKFIEEDKKFAAPLNGVEVKVEGDVAVTIDRIWLGNIISDLATNAKYWSNRKFMESQGSEIPGERPKVELTIKPRGDGMVLITAEDNGSGMFTKGVEINPVTNRQRCFDLDFTERLRGTGLGLNEVWRASGGNVRAWNKSGDEGTGAVFEVILPAANAAGGEFESIFKRIEATGFRFSGKKAKIERMLVEQGVTTADLENFEQFDRKSIPLNTREYLVYLLSMGHDSLLLMIVDMDEAARSAFFERIDRHHLFSLYKKCWELKMNKKFIPARDLTVEEFNFYLDAVSQLYFTMPTFFDEAAFQKIENLLREIIKRGESEPVEARAGSPMQLKAAEAAMQPAGAAAIGAAAAGVANPSAGLRVNSARAAAQHVKLSVAVITNVPASSEDIANTIREKEDLSEAEIIPLDLPQDTEPSLNDGMNQILAKAKKADRVILDIRDNEALRSFLITNLAGDEQKVKDITDITEPEARKEAIWSA